MNFSECFFFFSSNFLSSSIHLFSHFNNSSQVNFLETTFSKSLKLFPSTFRNHNHIQAVEVCNLFILGKFFEAMDKTPMHFLLGAIHAFLEEISPIPSKGL
jgi:hypothetical protein